MRGPVEVRDGVRVALLAHAVAAPMLAIVWSPSILCPPFVLLVGVLQLCYMLPLAVLLALCGRPRALLGVLLVAALGLAPLLLVRATGGLSVLPW